VAQQDGKLSANSRATAVSIGECMVELVRGADGRFGMALGGDTFNTAVYLARAGVAAAYLTALGDDAYSQAIVDLATSEGVDSSTIPRLPGRLPGLYLIETDAKGERTFYYWRENAPAREVFSGRISPATTQALNEAGLIYFSGITLWLYSRDGLEAFFAQIDAARQAGARIVFDSNYRKRLWGEAPEPARAAFAEAISRADIVLPSLDDERLLWGDDTAQDVLRRYADAGVAECVVKDAGGGAYVAEEGKLRHIAVPSRVDPVDTTAAGDSFNAAYLAARLAGIPPAVAVMWGHRLAAIVVSHRGAIVPKSATEALLAELNAAGSGGSAPA
jgi:2-dehydro-3-deoxygluconokinase